MDGEIPKMKRKIKKAITILNNGFIYIGLFGWKYGLSFVWHSFFCKKSMYKTRKMAIEICDKEFGYIFKSLTNYSSNDITIDSKQKNIFFFWAQGVNKLPELQQIVLRRIERYYGDYNIYLLDLENYNQFVQLDANIVQLFNRNRISIQTFSDILRFNLLYKFGGVWMDATLMNFSRLPLFEKICENGFFSTNMNSVEKTNLWGKVYPVTYTTYFLASCKGNGNMKACVQFYDQYYRKFDIAIDYFMTDYILILCMRYGLENNQLEKIEMCKSNSFYLNRFLNNENIDLEYLKLCPQKLNWRTTDVNNLKKKIEELDF